MDTDSLYLTASPTEKLRLQLLLIFAEEGDIDSILRTMQELEMEAYNRGWDDALYEKGTRRGAD